MLYSVLFQISDVGWRLPVYRAIYYRNRMKLLKQIKYGEPITIMLSLQWHEMGF